MLYYAYGSNLWQPRLECRLGSVRPVGIGRLGGYALRWHKRSKTDGSGKCDIVPLDGAEVIGVVYEFNDLKMQILDKFEGAGVGYLRVSVRVDLNGKPTDVVTYRATAIEEGILPYLWYHQLVVAGARHHALPAAYVENLAMQPTQPDRDRLRAASELAQLELCPRGV